MSNEKQIVIDCTKGESEEFKLIAYGEDHDTVCTTIVRGVPISLSYTVTSSEVFGTTEIDVTFHILCDAEQESVEAE